MAATKTAPNPADELKPPQTMPTWSKHKLTNQRINIILFRLHSELQKAKTYDDKKKCFTDCLSAYRASWTNTSIGAHITDEIVMSRLLAYLTQLGHKCRVNEVKNLWIQMTR